MSELLAELRTKWDEALSAPTSHREWRAIGLSQASPVKLLAGIRDRDGRISILIETALRHAPKQRVRFQAEGISLVDERAPVEGLLRLAVTLERADLRDIFEVLVLDLLCVVSNASSADLAIRQTIRRLEAWQVCLHVRRRGLAREDVVGLLGELAAMELVEAEISLAGAIAAWYGPLGGIHDFQVSGMALEVKSTIGLSHHMRISRLDQLDSEGIHTLVLLRTRFQETPDGLTLPEHVGNFRRRIDRGSPSASGEFNDKLMRAGYLDADAEVYGGTRTMLTDVQAFRVGEGFPRLTRAAAPSAIVDAAYSLDERQLGPYRISSEEFRTLVRQMSGL
jgi:hypothetical protein